MYLKELLQKPILSLYEGEILGNIRNVYFDKLKHKIKYFEIVSDEDICYCLAPKNIYTLGKHAITIRNKQHLTINLSEPISSNSILPIDVKVYSVQGEFLGLLVDYSISEKYEIDKLILDNQITIDFTDLASCSTNSMVVYYANERVNINSFRYRIQHKPAQQQKVKVLPKLFSSFNKISPQSEDKKANFIVGRICTKDIFDNEHNIIIKQNCTITDKTLALASGKNKLQDLMKYSKIK